MDKKNQYYRDMSSKLIYKFSAIKNYSQLRMLLKDCWQTDMKNKKNWRWD